MKTDLVERLDNLAARIRNDGTPSQIGSEHEIVEAKDEIERLRAKLAKAALEPAPKVTEEEVERAAKAIALAWGETWECCCIEQRGLDCDCGDAMQDDREGRPYDEDLTREDCRMAARAALEAAKGEEG